MTVDASPPLRSGETIVVRSNAGFEVLTVKSLAIDKHAVDEVAIGHAGVRWRSK